MDFRYFPYSFPSNGEGSIFDERVFPGGGFGPPGQPSGSPLGGPPGFPPGQPSGSPLGGPPGFPPGQPSGSPLGGPPGFPPSGVEGPPSSPPPSFTPQLQQQSVSMFAIDPGAIRGCLYRNTFVWLENGRSFWFYPTFVGRSSVAGWRWRGFRWAYYGTDLRRIRSFRCF
ncbi:hypothetical protein BGM26_18835 [Bacillus sp. FJAT-29790]|uniref:hypothetical protein n=1 Tax=Bacillus sp. FJAT-29790 TaxID=1895002 RepID=UPI001C24034E|nr:hypothetical protein [Bacillus sp. FJAT-29790]MBU8880979.1 hypothetical protein [Bacillus sp. FJAT-29790]